MESDTTLTVTISFSSVTVMDSVTSVTVNYTSMINVSDTSMTVTKSDTSKWVIESYTKVTLMVAYSSSGAGKHSRMLNEISTWSVL